MKPAKLLAEIFGFLLILLFAAFPSDGCPGGLEPAEGERDMDGSDLVVFAQKGSTKQILHHSQQISVEPIVQLRLACLLLTSTASGR